VSDGSERVDVDALNVDPVELTGVVNRIKANTRGAWGRCWDEGLHNLLVEDMGNFILGGVSLIL